MQTFALNIYKVIVESAEGNVINEALNSSCPFWRWATNTSALFPFLHLKGTFPFLSPIRRDIIRYLDYLIWMRKVRGLGPSSGAGLSVLLFPTSFSIFLMAVAVSPWAFSVLYTPSVNWDNVLGPRKAKKKKGRFRSYVSKVNLNCISGQNEVEIPYLHMKLR